MVFICCSRRLKFDFRNTGLSVYLVEEEVGQVEKNCSYWILLNYMGLGTGNLLVSMLKHGVRKVNNVKDDRISGYYMESAVLYSRILISYLILIGSKNLLE